VIAGEYNRSAGQIKLGEQFAKHRDGRQRDVAAGGNRGARSEDCEIQWV